MTATLSDRIDSRLARAGLATCDPMIGLAPGSAGAPSRAWPWRRYAELSRALRREFPAHRQTIVVTPEDLWVGVRLHEETGKIHPVLGPDSTPDEQGELISRLDLLIGGDQPVLQLGIDAGLSVVGIYGPTRPPAGTPGLTALHQERWCSPCGLRRCPLLLRGCQRAISITMVLRACETALREKAKKEPSS